MTVWTVIGGIAALAGLMAAVLTPMFKLNTSITRLTDAVTTLQANLKDFADKNTDSHSRLWLHEEVQDRQLADHETRIQIIEQSDRKG